MLDIFLWTVLGLMSAFAFSMPLIGWWESRSCEHLNKEVNYVVGGFLCFGCGRCTVPEGRHP